jgi:hypothetical protein
MTMEGLQQEAHPLLSEVGNHYTMELLNWMEFKGYKNTNNLENMSVSLEMEKLDKKDV